MIIFCAKYLIFIIGLMVLAVLAKLKSRTRWEFTAAVILAGVTALILSKLASTLYYHPRPFVTSGVQPLVAHAANNGFPSDHTTVAAALAMVIYFYRRKLGAITFVLAALVGIGRVAAHVHSPVDILGGAVLGVLAGSAGYWLAKKLLDKHPKPPVV